jgi:hypothetical protein
MDSKAVSKEIKGSVWPLLKQEGFSRFTSRSAWRYCGSKIDVVNFQSFNAYNASVMGLTPFSFAVNLGVFLTYVPPQWPPKQTKGDPTPHEAECHLRGRLVPHISQARNAPEGLWSVDEQGSNLLWCVQDVAAQAPSAMAWFARFNDKREVLRVLQEEDEDMMKLWGFGRNPSPLRSYMAGYVALALGDEAFGRLKLREAVDSNCFVGQFGTVEEAMRRASS